MDMNQFSRMITDNLQYIIIGMTVLILLSLAIFISINVKLSRLNRRYQIMMSGMENKNIEQLLLGHIEEVRRGLTDIENLNQKCQRLDAVLRNCVQRVGIIRFNAFEDTGSDLSFAIALLDNNNNGVLVSSIFGRNDSRTYAKPVVAGQSTYFLTAEEKAALQKAQESSLIL